MLGDELSIDLKTSSSKLTSKKNEKVRVKYNSKKSRVMLKKNLKKPSIIYENKGLEISNLGKRYKNRPILRGINLRVKKERSLACLDLMVLENNMFLFYNGTN